MIGGASFLAGGCASLKSVPAQPVVQALPAPEDGLIYQTVLRLREQLEPNETSFLLLPENKEALLWRLALVDSARTSIDMKYFIWQGDTSGNLLFSRIVAAADRGVRVRILVDDMVFAAKDKTIAAICLHPHIDLKLFNPIKARGPISSTVAFFLRMKKYNRRMHNKSLVVDNQIGIAGGRNVGDEYFGLAEHYNFRDLDVLVTGAVIPQMSASFDEFWNTEMAYPGSAVSSRASEETLHDLRKQLDAYLKSQTKRMISYPIDSDAWAERLQSLPDRMVSGTAHVVQDKPVHIKGKTVRLIDLLRQMSDEHTQELLISSPYLIPTGDFLEHLADANKEGTRVKILTASLGSNNHTAAHTYYKKYRKRFLAAGVELHEFDPEPSPEVRQVADVPPVRSGFISPHIKALVADRERCFIGSLNLDPRAIDLNTENGLYIESPELGAQLAELIEQLADPSNAWRVYLDEKGKVRWSSDRGTITSQPARTGWQRIQAFFYRLLPIEKQL